MNKMENLFGELRLFSLIYIPHTCTLLSSKRKRLEAWFDRLLLWTLFIITPLTFNQNDSTTQRPSFSEKSVLVNESATEWSPSRNDGQNWSQFTFLKSNRADVLSSEWWKWVCVPVFDSPILYTEKNDENAFIERGTKSVRIINFVTSSTVVYERLWLVIYLNL